MAQRTCQLRYARQLALLEGIRMLALSKYLQTI